MPPAPTASTASTGLVPRGTTPGARALAAGCRTALAALLLAGVAGPPATGDGAGGGESGARVVLAALPPQRAETLLERKRVMMPDDGDGFVTALVVFERPRSRVLELLGQPGRQREYRPELRRIVRIETYPDGALDEHHLRVMFMSVRYRMRYRIGPDRIAWELDPTFDNDVEHVEGFWELYAMGEDRTLGRLGTRVDVGSAVPGFLQDAATRKNLPETVERVRRWVNSDGHWRP